MICYTGESPPNMEKIMKKRNFLGKILAVLSIAGIAGIMAVSAPVQANEPVGMPEADPLTGCTCPDGFSMCAQGNCLGNANACRLCCNNHDPSYCAQ